LRVIPAIDSRAWHYVLVLAQGALLLGVLLSYGQFAVLWRELRKLLQHFSMHPMVGAFERLPRRLIGQFRWNPLPEMPHTGPLLGQYFQLLAHHIDVVNTVGGSAREVAEAGLEATQSTHGRLALAMPRIAAVVRTERWLRPPLTSAPEAANLAIPAAPTHDPRQVWFDRAEELIAIHVAQYINYVFLHLWNLLTCAMLALLLLLFANGAYPLQPQQLLNAFLFAIAVTGGRLDAAGPGTDQSKRSAVPDPEDRAQQDHLRSTAGRAVSALRGRAPPRSWPRCSPTWPGCSRGSRIS
jgi:hypothetical protein